MKALSLFSGIGGIDLACEWAGIKTVAFCEREPFCQKVLAKHWPNVPIYDDVCTLTKERLEADGIGTIDVVFSGDPCQPYSHAGDRKGEEDDRFLWPEVNRLLETVRPRWVVRENVAGNITLGLDGVLADLDDLGYAWQSFIIPACAVNAPHRRDRVFVIAYDKCQGWKRVLHPQLQTSIGPYPHWAANALDAHRHPVPRMEESIGEPALFRSDDGLSAGVDRSMIVPRLQALGNAVNPYQIYPILTAIKQIDDMLKGA